MSYLSLRFLFSFFWHLLPLLFLVSERWPLFFASIGLISLPYIKIKKLSLALGDLQKTSTDDAQKNDFIKREIRGLENAILRWQWFTLPWFGSQAATNFFRR